MLKEILFLLAWIFGTTLVLYFPVTWVMAWIETKSSPRKPMFWCAKHGAIPTDTVIKFMEAEYCPICFHERLKTAEHGGRA
jgi:hypothetical protein